MKLWKAMLGLALAAATLAGCGAKSASSAAAAGNATPTPGTVASVYTSTVLLTDYEGALPASSQLALGTLKLEGTDNAVTPDQAKELLPFWQALQSGVLKSDVETNTVLGQIERAMTDKQLAAMAAMHLTDADMLAVIQERGLPANMPAGQGAPAGQPPSGQGGPGNMGNLTDAQRAAMRATAEAGGMPAGGPGGGNGGQFAAMRATAEAGGTSFPGPRGGTDGASAGQVVFLARPVVELLTQRAGG